MNKRTQSTRLNKINQEIRAKQVRLMNINGEQIGIVNITEALDRARSEGFDLVEISSNSEPPVCRIMNYGKFIYEKNKSIKEQKKKQKIVQIKEVKFRPVIDKSDYQVKLRSLIRFLKEGNKVKITLRFRGREIVHQKIGITILKRICHDLSQLAVVECFPSQIEGKQMIMILSPKR